MFYRTLIRIVLQAGIFTIVLAQAALACTGITLKAEDGAVVYGRTLEWGAFNPHSELMVVPRGHKFIAQLQDGIEGLSWTAKYGGVAIAGFGKPYFLDGMNEVGLAVGAFYLPGFAKYQEFDPSLADISMGPTDFMAYIATNHATVAEARAALETFRVVPVIEPSLGIVAPIHYIITDPTGEAIVVEYLEGVLKVFDAPLGVITNSPSYDWHITNLRNYINLSPVALPDVQIGDLTLSPVGAGSGMIGLPGDFTPPSRFIRAVAFSKTARSTSDGEETIYELFRILDNFNLPITAAEGSDMGGDTSDMRSSTVWTSASDTRNRVFYYHTMHNRRLRSVDLKEIDFGGISGEIRFLPLDSENSQDIEPVEIGG